MVGAESYNPFKMLGAYTGGIIGILSLYIYAAYASGLGHSKPPEAFIFFTNLLTFGGVLNNFFPLGNLIFIFLCGFLIGWGIHSFFRKIV